MTPEPTHAARLADLNATIRYTMWSVFQATAERGSDVRTGREALAESTTALVQDLADGGVTTRGLYDLSGYRADADVMVWWHASTPEALQDAYGRLRRSPLGQHLVPVWSAVGLHRPAEFNRSHVPAFLAGEPPRSHVCVYPFVRSPEWYLLPEEERRHLLAEHGMMARDYPDVRANTVAGFALGDYEWLLAFEADELHRIVDLMRTLRASGARRHVRLETPFFTGRRCDVSHIVTVVTGLL